MNNGETLILFLVVTLVGVLVIGVFAWRDRYQWPPPGLKRDEFLRCRLGLAPRRRLLPHLHLPRLRLRR
jgi:hypothetical protein